MKNFKIRFLFNHFHYFLFTLIIALLGYVNIFYLLLYIPFYLLVKGYHFKWVLFVFGGLSFLYVLLFTQVFNKPPRSNNYVVTEKIEKDNYYTYYIKDGIYKYTFNYKDELNIGDVINVKYDYETFTNSKTPNTFNFKNYYSSKRVFYKLNIKKIDVVDSKFHVNMIREKIKGYFNNYPYYSKQYIMLFLFNEDHFDEDFKVAKTSLGIAHLFALSGMHINFFIMLIDYIYKRFNKRSNNYLIITILVLYLWLTNYSLSLLRAVLMYVLYSLFNKKGLTKLDSLSLSFIIMIIINPFYIYRIGFILSYLVSFLLVVSEGEKGVKAVIINHFKIIMLTFLIVSNINGGFYIFSFFTSLLLTLIFPVIIMPLIFISIIPFVSSLIEPFLNGFTDVLLNMSNDYLIKISHQSLFSILIYLGIYVYCIFGTNKDFLKRSGYLFIYIVVIYLLPNFNLNETVYFLDVNHGDATFIYNKIDGGNILIDANTGTYDFLMTLGDIKIDHFFITHGDSDHAIEAEQIIKEFNVKNIYVSPYDDSVIVKGLNKYNLIKVSKGDKFLFGDINIDVLGPLKDYHHLNNNSLVLKMSFTNFNCLFTGDIEQDAVDDLIKYYGKNLSSDILHVAHHGSKTGTTLAFLDCIMPKEAIISAGKNNFYNHPHKEVIDDLRKRNIVIKETSKNQTIIKKKYDFSFKKIIEKLIEI